MSSESLNESDINEFLGSAYVKQTVNKEFKNTLYTYLLNKDYCDNVDSL
jgi:hypothetical protein